MGRVFVPFLEEIEDTKKTFRSYLTFNVKLFQTYLPKCQLLGIVILEFMIQNLIHLISQGNFI